MHVSVFPRVWNFGPGQHTFIYFPDLGWGKGWESHPFSVAGWRRAEEQPLPVSIATHSTSDQEQASEKHSDIESTTRNLGLQSSTTSSNQQEGSLQQARGSHRASIEFLVRGHGGMTSWLRNSISSRPSGNSMELSAYTEGPYAGHRATLQPFKAADTILCLVGGIGITHALGFVQAYTEAKLRGEDSGERHGVMRRAKRFILAWSAREMALIEHVKRRFLAPENQIDGIEYSFWCTDASSSTTQKSGSIDDNEESQRAEGVATEATVAVTTGRMNVGTVIRSSLEVGYLTTVLVCGPGNMADEATKEIVNCVKDGFKVDLVEEAYAW
jgi:hypothetical protein